MVEDKKILSMAIKDFVKNLTYEEAKKLYEGLRIKFICEK